MCGAQVVWALHSIAPAGPAITCAEGWGPIKPCHPPPQSVVRGLIATSERWLNTISGWLLALFPGARREVRSRTRAHTEAWRAWLKGAGGGLFARPGTSRVPGMW